MAVNAAEPQVEPPYLFWRVSPAQSGATFEIERRTVTRSWWFGYYWEASSWTGTTTITDCVAVGQCTSTGDLDPDPGEFQITHAGPSHRIPQDTSSIRYEYQVRPAQAPAGTFWESTEWRLSDRSNRPNGIGDVGVFSTGANAAAVCTGGTFYSLSTNGVVNQVGGSSAAVTRFGQFTGIADSNAQMNALGIALGGTAIYAVERPSGSASSIAAVHRYTATAGWQRIPYTGTAVNTGAVLGAVNLADGRYYFGGYTTSGSSTTFRLFAFDPATSSVTSRGSFTTAMSGTSNGDMAFDLQGNLFVVQSFDSGTSRIYTVSAAALAAGGTMPFTASPQFAGMARTNGMAFEGDGSIYLGSSDTVRIYDPSTNSLRSGSITTALSGSGDLASCLAPATLTVRKNVVGRVAASDQFTLSALRGSLALGSVTTSGTADGMQPTQLGPLTALAGQTYTIQETISANAGSYTSSYTCVDSTGATIASGSARSGSVTIPDRSGASVVCTFRNAPLVSSVVVRKVVQGTDGTGEDPGVGWSVTADARATSGSVTSVPGAATQTTDAAGEASWLLRFGSTTSVASIAVSETQQAGHAFVQGSCIVTTIAGATSEIALPNAQGTTLTGIAPGSSVDCTIVNRVLPTTLTLAKSVAFGSADPTSWRLLATGPQGARPGPAGASLTTAEITPGVAYRLTESGGPATYVQTGSWVCTDELGATVAVSSAADVTVTRTGARVTCTVTNQTAMLTLLKVVVNDNGGTIEADGFDLTATPSPFTGLTATTVEGASTVLRANTFEVRPGHAYALSEDMGDYAYLGQSIQRYTGPSTASASELAADANWQTLTAAQAAAVTVPAGQRAIYRFVNDDAPALSLPLTGGIGADTYLFGGAGLLLLGLLVAAFPLLRTRLGPSRTLPSMHIPRPQNTNPSAFIQKGSAVMASTKKSLTARIVAGFGAAAIATFAVLGGALPASAAPDNIKIDELGSITVHKFVEPAVATGLANDGSVVDTTGLTALEGVEFTVERVTNIDLSTTAGWMAAEALTPATTTAANLALVGAVETNAAGVAEFEDLPIGVYLVTETATGPNQIAVKAAPFLVSVPLPLNNTWLYDVNVYPKNSITSIDKTVDDSSAYGLGDEVSWTITADVPEVATAADLASFVISDSLDARLGYVSATVTGTGVTLVPADYTLVQDGQDVTVTFTPAGLAKLAAANAASITVEIVTTVDEIVTAVDGLESGIINNTANLAVNGGSFDSSVVSTEWGTIAILKYEAREDSDDMTGVLQGAEFQVFASEAEALALTNPIEVDGEDTFTSGENGIAFVPGLRADVEYWIVEIKAPVGYEVSPTPIPAYTVTAGDVEATTVDVRVANSQVPAYALPVTGGSGQAAFMIGGAGLLLGALGFMLIRRRKAQADT
ncbi:SpaH/EbpB family LPXTG-anchored major pilin [Agrococcus sp. ProA11]|uniref:SpaH/EbpB family LPXTG-anchored major pilin n=1 Tax=Agrococcus chionoecetis TaxID=3153752 RepID=UPI0032602DDD